eukprot:jgi/Tetstr1/432236/TSEL_002272.t1
MCGRGSPTDPKMMDDAGKAAAVEGVETSTNAEQRIEAGRHAAADATRMMQLIHEQLSKFFAIQVENPMPLAKRSPCWAGTKFRAGNKDHNARATFDPSNEAHYLGWKPLRLATSLPDSENGLPTDNLRRAELSPIALDRVLEYLLKLTEIPELHKDRVYDANIASAAKTSARQRFGGGHLRTNRNRDGGWGNCGGNFKTARPKSREALAPRAAFAKDDSARKGSIEAMYGKDDWGAKVLDLLTTSLSAITYSNCEGKIRLFAELCID